MNNVGVSATILGARGVEGGAPTGVGDCHKLGCFVQHRTHGCKSTFVLEANGEVKNSLSCACERGWDGVRIVSRRGGAVIVRVCVFESAWSRAKKILIGFVSLVSFSLTIVGNSVV